MTSQELLDYLCKLSPEFEEVWPNSYSIRDDGTFTHHGVFSEFSWYFRDNIARFDSAKLERLFNNIEHWKVDETKIPKGQPYSDAENLSNAAFVCFIENIAGEGLTEKITPFMGEETLKMYKQYDFSG